MVCACIKFRQLSIYDKGKKKKKKKKKWENWLKGKATIICIYTRARNSSLHKHTLFISSGVYVCKRAGVICFMIWRTTCYTLSSVARSINRFCILESACWWLWEKESEAKKSGKQKKRRERFNFSINTEHCCCFFSIRSSSLLFFFRFVHLDNALVFFFPSFFLPSVLVLTFPYHRHRSIIFYSVYLSTVKSDSFIILMLNHYMLYLYQNH